MKKFATLMLALAMLISCAAIGMAEDITLDVIICQYGPKTNDWFTGTGMNGTSFVKKFEEANPGIKLNLEVVSWNDVYTVVSTRISNNNAPDILNLDSFADYANEGLLMPVKDYCPEELYNDFFPSFIEQSVIDGTVWAVPDLASARALYYNVDLLEAAGVEVPTTWAELEDVCQALVDFYGGGVSTRGDVFAGFHVIGFQNDVGFEVIALKKPVLNGADAVAFGHADKFLAHRVFDIDGLAVLEAVRQFGGARGHQHNLLVFDEHIVEAVGFGGCGDETEIALAFGRETLKGVAAIFQQVDFDIRVAFDKFRNDEGEQLNAALAGNAHAHAAVHLFFGFGDFSAQIAVDIQHGLRGFDVALTGIGEGDGIG